MKEKLVELQKNAYAPISKFYVSAIVVTKDGKEFSGVNVEDASTRAGSCAERVALFNMVTKGYKKGDIKEINLMGSSNDVITPCFVCRQLIYEFCSLDTKINCYSHDGKLKTYTVEELCPHAFGEDDLK